jgi:uracil-DNA glycosylase
MVCLLGGVATKALLGINRLSEGRGKVFRRGKRIFFPAYHPAGAGRNRSWYWAFADDMERLKRLAESLE